MDDQLWRLTWALPLVVLIGVGAIFWLKRMGVGIAPSGPAALPVVHSDTAVSAHTRVLVVEVEGRRFAVFESTAQISVQAPVAETHPLAPRAWWRKT